MRVPLEKVINDLKIKSDIPTKPTGKLAMRWEIHQAREEFVKYSKIRKDAIQSFKENHKPSVFVGNSFDVVFAYSLAPLQTVFAAASRIIYGLAGFVFPKMIIKPSSIPYHAPSVDPLKEARFLLGNIKLSEEECWVEELLKRNYDNASSDKATYDSICAKINQCPTLEESDRKLIIGTIEDELFRAYAVGIIKEANMQIFSLNEYTWFQKLFGVDGEKAKNKQELGQSITDLDDFFNQLNDQDFKVAVEKEYNRLPE